MIRLVESIVGVSQSWQPKGKDLGCILCRIESEAVRDQDPSNLLTTMN